MYLLYILISMKTTTRLAKKLCKCIKNVRKTVKTKTTRTLKQREKAAIAICVKSVLQSRRKTLKRFHCTPRPYLVTQRIRDIRYKS
jgi:hypothetical protein